MFHSKYINSCVKSSLSQAYTYPVLCYQWRNKKVLPDSNYYKGLYTKYNEYYEDYCYIFITPIFKTQKYSQVLIISWFLIKNNFINWPQSALKFYFISLAMQLLKGLI